MSDGGLDRTGLSHGSLDITGVSHGSLVRTGLFHGSLDGTGACVLCNLDRTGYIAIQVGVK